MRGRRPKPTAVRRRDGNPGKRAWNDAEPVPPEGLPDCPEHLSVIAADEWHRVARTLYDMGVLTTIDRAVLAAYCQAYGRWVEAERKLQETPQIFKTPSGYVQQSPWLGIANKALDQMGRCMVELGMTPAARSRVSISQALAQESMKVEFVTVYEQMTDAELEAIARGSGDR